MDALLARFLSLAGKVWLRLTGPSGMRLLAPVLGALLVYLGWRLWRIAGRSALGRSLRWWAVAGGAAVCVGGLLYELAAVPEDPELRAALREAIGEGLGLGRVPLPAPLALAGAIAVAGAALLAAWRWRLARLSPYERAMLDAAWHRLRRRARLPVAAALGAAACLAVVFACAPAGPAQVPQLDAGTSGGSGETGRPSAGATLWIGTTAGVSRLAPGPSGARWQALLRPAAPLPANQVTGLASGPAGEVWIATHGGLARYVENADGPQWQTATVENAGLPYPTVLGLAVDRQGVAWAATGAGAAMVDRPLQAGAPSATSRAFTNLNAPLMHQIMDAVHVDPTGDIWFGGAGGVNVYRPDQAGRPGEWLTGFNRFSTAGGLPDNQVYAIFGDSRGRIWMGTAAGVAALTPQADGYGLGAFERARWQTYTRPGAPLAAEAVHAIAEDRQGRIYFGTQGGITVLDEAQTDPVARWRQIGGTTQPGGAGSAASGAGSGPLALPDPWVQALAIGPDGRLWAGTRGGLAVYDPSRPQNGWSVYRADPRRRWLGFLWPFQWGDGHIVGDDVTSIAFAH